MTTNTEFKGIETKSEKIKKSIASKKENSKITEPELEKMLQLMTLLFQEIQEKSHQEKDNKEFSSDVENVAELYRKIRYALRVPTPLKPQIDEPRWYLPPLNPHVPEN